MRGPSENVRPVRWLLLDIGGVLEVVDDDAWPARFRERWAERLGLPVAEFERRVDEADLPDAATRSGVADAYWSAYGAAVGASAGDLAAMRADFWDEYCGRANTELLAELRALRGEADLAILSNSGDGAREEEERRYGFSDLFDPVLYSHETGVAKPDARAFAIALRRMDAEPAEVLFVDDVQANVDAALRLGLRAHRHLDTAGTLARIRAELGR